MPSKSILTFLKYEVDKLLYEPSHAQISGELSYNPVFEKAVSEEENGYFFVRLSVSIAGTEERPFPFRVEAAITGHFHIEAAGISDNLKRSLMNRNTVSILFPFLRAIVASLTSAANVVPLILPVINLNDGSEADGQSGFDANSPPPPADRAIKSG